MTKSDRRLGWAQIAAATPGGSVLVVDDDPDIRSTLNRMITRFGYDVKTASSAEEADSWLGAQAFEAVLLDIELPRMTGIEFLKWILERNPEMSVIMLTGLDDPALAVRCLDNGARTYLVKPIESEFLRLALRDAVALGRLLKERNAGRA